MNVALDNYVGGMMNEDWRTGNEMLRVRGNKEVRDMIIYRVQCFMKLLLLFAHSAYRVLNKAELSESQLFNILPSCWSME